MIPIALVVCPYGEIIGLIQLCFHAAACKKCGESIYDMKTFGRAADWLGHHLSAHHGLAPSLMSMPSGCLYPYGDWPDR